MIKITFNGQQFMNQVQGDLKKNLAKAGFWGQSQLRKEVNVGQPYRRSGKEVIRYRGLQPSRPGAYPKKVTGQFQRSIVFNVDDLRVSFGSTLTDPAYGAFLQLGTSRMRPRPWLTLFLNQYGAKLGNIILGGQP